MGFATLGASYLQIFWLVQAGVYILLTFFSFVTGSHWDKSQSHRDVENGLGWLEFRKRPGWLYWIAFLCVIYIAWTILSACIYGTPPNDHFIDLYNLVTSPKQTTTGLGCTYLALALYLVHVSWHLYECIYVSIFSRRQVIGPISFVRDHLCYIGAGLSLVAESPEFVQREECFTFSEFRWYHLLVIVVFFIASKIRHSTHSTLAKLRRNKSGHVVTTNYKMPKGGWFDKLDVSNPHYLAEIIIYVCIGIVLGLQNFTWWTITAYIAANQIYRAYSTQELYKYKFEDYPKERKMLIPFLF